MRPRQRPSRLAALRPRLLRRTPADPPPQPPARTSRSGHGAAHGLPGQADPHAVRRSADRHRGRRRRPLPPRQRRRPLLTRTADRARRPLPRADAHPARPRAAHPPGPRPRRPAGDGSRMTMPTARARSHEDREAIRVLRAHGYDVPDVQALVRDQRAFAVRVTDRDLALAPGVRLRSRCADLGAGSFTNVHTLTLDLDAVQAEVHSRPDTFHLPDLVSGSILAAVSGSFAFISDDPAYQPAEPCLDFCCRSGTVISAPTAEKPALLVRDGRPVIMPLPASGTLTLGGRPYRWIGSKEPGPSPDPSAPLVVYGAANCEIRHRDHPRTGFLRHVDRPSNVTPLSASAVDYVVTGSPERGLRVSQIRPGGGSDLFSGSFILRADRPVADVTLGAPVEITEITGHEVGTLQSGISLGPSVADAADGLTAAYDASLGKSPFRSTRHARTLIALHDGRLALQILDGAPNTDTFRGATPQETAELCAADGLDPRHVYHLDGGASSKIAYRHAGRPRVVGSMHYLRWPTAATEPFHWQGLQGRALHSAIILKPRS
ncbi:hypothetical protein CP969_00560 [Streptomyces viridosporus T7A]|uniref:Phosphodiester glycosidase domain-containing protein n=2 Tax=Streptomyces viridosporus TaxID=67581 RepID=A0ABX6A955_STRVD|nr:hypothetical protein CP969_00560 [Streptomyces viridosporus T7A]